MTKGVMIFSIALVLAEVDAARRQQTGVAPRSLCSRPQGKYPGSGSFLME